METVSQIPPRDVAGAKKLLAEAGYGPDNPLKFDLHTAEVYPGYRCFAQLYANQAKDAGIEVNVVETPPETYWDTYWTKTPAMLVAHDQRHPTNGLTNAHYSKATYNETHFFIQEYDALIDKANATLDKDEEGTACTDRLRSSSLRMAATSSRGSSSWSRPCAAIAQATRPTRGFQDLTCAASLVRSSS